MKALLVGSLKRHEIMEHLQYFAKAIAKSATHTAIDGIVNDAYMLAKNNMTLRDLDDLVHELVEKAGTEDDIRKGVKKSGVDDPDAITLIGALLRNKAGAMGVDEFRRYPDLHKVASSDDGPDEGTALAAIRKAHRSPRSGDPTFAEGGGTIRKLDNDDGQPETAVDAIKKAHKKPKTMR